MEPSSRGRVSETSSLVQRNEVSRPLLLLKSGAKGALSKVCAACKLCMTDCDVREVLPACPTYHGANATPSGCTSHDLCSTGAYPSLGQIVLHVATR